MTPLLGIDFGTSAARAAVVVDGEASLVTHASGGSSMPSLVAFPPAASGGGPPLVGAAALAVAARHPERTVAAVKRLLGRKLEAPEVRHQRLAVPYDLVAARNGDVRVRVGRRHHTPQDIAAYIFGALRAAAERQIGGPVTEAVLAVPSMFDDLQRQAIRDAARIAGLEVRGVITQTSAAVLGSGIFPPARGEERRILVYDLGGGSFEVSAVLVGDWGLKVEATSGDAFLGGADFDQRVVAFVCEEVLRTEGGDLRKDRSQLARLTVAAERAKIELSIADSVDIHIPKAGGRAASMIRLDRSRLETLTRDLVDRTQWACEGVLRDAKWEAADVETVLLLGGQTHMPYIRRQVGDLVGKPLAEIAGAESLVALGAAQQAAAITSSDRRGRSRGRSLVAEQSGLSLGFESAGGVFTRLISRGTPLPASLSQVLSTATDGQTQIIMHLLQGEREMATDNESVARVQIGPLPARPRGEIQIAVEITIHGGGLPGVEARDSVSGEAKQVRLRPSGGLTEAEILALTAVHAGKSPEAAAAVAAPELTDEAVELVGPGEGKAENRDAQTVHPRVPGG